MEVGAAITWKYPSCILQGDNSVGEFYSVALTNGHMQADTGTKMIHLGKNTSSTIISKGIAADLSHNSYRGLVKIVPKATGARNYTQCDSMLVGNQCSANTFPYIEVGNSSSQVEHEASTSKLNEEQLFYFQSRGIAREDAINMIVNGFCKEVIRRASSGICHGSAKTVNPQTRKFGGITMIEIKNLWAKIDGKTHS